MLDDTIAAIATPLGEGGLAVVRLSGPQALAVADRAFVPVGKSSLKPSAAPTHTIQYGKIVRQGRTVDEVLLSVMRAPRTFTREDAVEITCHGGILAAKLVLDTVLENGARLAEPGEFTRRAFLNGRIDLAQAEAVADLIHSRTVLSRLERGVTFMDELLRTANEGQIFRRGIRTAIIGRPNVGKSSLLNQLLGHDRAIVSPIAGTTRDTIEETANIRGLPVVFVDTAGLREAGDAVEREGIRRSRESVAKAELILHVFDASEPFTPEDDNYLKQFAHKKRILVRNKTDLPSRLALPEELVAECATEQTAKLTPGPSREGNCPRERKSEENLLEERSLSPASNLATRSAVVDVCALSGEGIEALKDAIKNLVWAGEIKAEMLQVMINSRHQDALRRAREATIRTIDALRGDLTLELVALDLRIAVNAVGEVVGKTTTEDLLDSIFSQFCIGK